MDLNIFGALVCFGTQVTFELIDLL